MDRCLDHCYVAAIFIEVFRILLLYMVVYGYSLDHCYVADIFIEVFRMLLLYMVVYGYM